MKIKIKRTYLNKVTKGDAELVDDNGNVIMQFKTIELPDLNNIRKKSCIPEGTYKVTARTSEKYGQHLHINDVPDRDLILMHNGNFISQTEGCVLVGDGHTDINRDGIIDVTNSKATLKKLVKLAKTPLYIEITRA